VDGLHVGGFSAKPLPGQLASRHKQRQVLATPAASQAATLDIWADGRRQEEFSLRVPEHWLVGPE
jgi:hypothetical protein